MAWVESNYGANLSRGHKAKLKAKMDTIGRRFKTIDGWVTVLDRPDKQTRVVSFDGYPHKLTINARRLRTNGNLRNPHRKGDYCETTNR